jgi:hypothetical protein
VRQTLYVDLWLSRVLLVVKIPALPEGIQALVDLELLVQLVKTAIELPLHAVGFVQWHRAGVVVVGSNTDVVPAVLAVLAFQDWTVTVHLRLWGHSFTVLGWRH